MSGRGRMRQPASETRNRASRTVRRSTAGAVSPHAAIRGDSRLGHRFAEIPVHAVGSDLVLPGGPEAPPRDRAKDTTIVAAIVALLSEAVTDGKMARAFADMPADRQRHAREDCEEAAFQVTRLEAGFRDHFPPLDRRETWERPVGAIAGARRHLALLVDVARVDAASRMLARMAPAYVVRLRDPIRLKYGWHRIVTRNGVTVGYLLLESWQFRILDMHGVIIEGGETPLQSLLIDPIDLVSGGLAGVARGALRGAMASFARRLAPRIAAATLAFDLGLAEAAGGALGRSTASVFIASEVLSGELVPLARTAAAAPVRAAAVESAAATAVDAAADAIGGAAAKAAPAAGAAQPTVAVTAGTVAAEAGLRGVTTLRVTQREFQDRLGFVNVGHYDNVVLHAVERAGQRAAAVLAAGNNAESQRFIDACRNGHWKLAGTLFHAEAARQLRATAAATPASEMRLTAEDPVQRGKGGSRLDVVGIDAAGRHYDIDWKPTGRSALSSRSRAEMRRHAAHYEANRGTALSVQISRSWVDFVRPLIRGVEWP
jgi:hypothetical protein